MNDTSALSVVGICGSLRPGSYTKMALEVALSGARQLGVQTKLIDLKEYRLIFCDGNKDETVYPEDLFKLRQEVKQAQGIILGTPEYHGSFSGVLKNALDLMGFDEIEGKMIGLVGVSAGKLGAINALNGLRNVGRALHAWVIPEQVAIAQVWRVFDANHNITDPEIEARLLEVGQKVARFAYLHSSSQAMEFLKLWEASPFNPGGSNLQEE